MRKAMIAILVGSLALAGTASAFYFEGMGTEGKAALMQATADGDYDYYLEKAEEYDCKFTQTQEEFELHGEYLNALAERDYQRAVEVREQMHEQRQERMAEQFQERAGQEGGELPEGAPEQGARMRGKGRGPFFPELGIEN